MELIHILKINNFIHETCLLCMHKWASNECFVYTSQCTHNIIARRANQSRARTSVQGTTVHTAMQPAMRKKSTCHDWRDWLCVITMCHTVVIVLYTLSSPRHSLRMRAHVWTGVRWIGRNTDGYRTDYKTIRIPSINQIKFRCRNATIVYESNRHVIIATPKNPHPFDVGRRANGQRRVHKISHHIDAVLPAIGKRQCQLVKLTTQQMWSAADGEIPPVG